MRQAVHIFKREFKSYFLSPIAYIAISLFLLVAGWFFFSTFFAYNQASMRNFFSLLPYIFSFVVPAVTMRLFSEELNMGTYEALLTMPVTYTDVILGKTMAAAAFICAMLAPTLSYPLFISMLGDLDWGPVFGGYIGAVMLGAAFSCVGLFASSLTRNQVVAFIVGSAICFGMTVMDQMLVFFPSAVVGFFQYLSADFHFQNIAKGVVDSRDALYFLSVCFTGLYCSNLAMQAKR